MQVQQGDEEAVEQARGNPDYEAEHDGQRKGQAGGVREPDGHGDQGEVRADREVYAAGDDDQGHPERHEPHLDEEARGVEHGRQGEEQRVEHDITTTSAIEDAEQDDLPREPQPPDGRR